MPRRASARPAAPPLAFIARRVEFAAARHVRLVEAPRDCVDGCGPRRNGSPP